MLSTDSKVSTSINELFTCITSPTFVDVAVLRSCEEAKERGFKGDELSKWVDASLKKHNLHKQSGDSNKDIMSHFILRLAYCRT